jgi:hypothetical protein
MFGSVAKSPRRVSQEKPPFCALAQLSAMLLMDSPSPPGSAEFSMDITDQKMGTVGVYRRVRYLQSTRHTGDEDMAALTGR